MIRRRRWLGACLAVGIVALGVHLAARQPSGWPGGGRVLNIFGPLLDALTAEGRP